MRNAYSGYTFQEKVTSLFLAKMDVERNIDKIEIEADVDNKFDDIKISSNNSEYYFQIKDFKSTSINDLKFVNNSVEINGTLHKLSKSINVLFFKEISIIPNCNILGIPAFKTSGIYILSYSRKDIDELIVNLYQQDVFRKQEIERCFDECLDNRLWTIKKDDLPSIKTFNTNLNEPTIDIGKKHLEFENLLIIEGKAGVGKSHFVNSLSSEYTNSILYRFWVGNQDRDYQQRLKYRNFIYDISKKLFRDQIHRSEDEIMSQIKRKQKVVIIDGLDHVENYNSNELDSYIKFIEKLKKSCKTIVLTRPLRRVLEWQKFQLSNWNKEQTKKVLDELFHITSYSLVNIIFEITNGYPILIKYIAEYYKAHKTIPEIERLESVDNYYNAIINQKTGLQALSIFLCSRSYFMKSELELFLDEEPLIFVANFIKEHPYLFEIRLNRISLFHDSFNTFLRKQDIKYNSRLEDIVNEVYDSIINLNKRFLSRFAYFSLTPEMKKNVVEKYSSIHVFKELIKDTIDFEAIQAFYTQIREELCERNYSEIDIIQYYDLSLIFNIVHRDHISTINEFYYTYVKTLLFNGFSEEDITSSRYLFAMLSYVKANDATLLYNTTGNDFYETSHFYEHLQNDTEKEDYYFNQHNEQLTKSDIDELLEDKYELRDNLAYVLENLFIHNQTIEEYKKLSDCIYKYMNDEKLEAVSILDRFLSRFSTNSYYPEWILRDARNNILSFGNPSVDNSYKTPKLYDFISKYKDLGSFDLRDRIHNYIRLSLHEKRNLDISSIALFWTKYYQRKDYSLINIDTSLSVFEKFGYISKLQSVNIIKEIQDVSEKGYRGLLIGYIEQHPTDIITFIENNYSIEELRIEWFLLNAEYINVLSDKIFNYALNQILTYHRSNKEIELRDIKNVLYSNRKDELISNLNFWRYSVRIENNSPLFDDFENSGLKFKKQIPDSYDYKDDSLTRYNRGIISLTDKELIQAKGLKSYEVAGYSDDNYSALVNTDFFELYEKSEIQQNIQHILYNAMLGKTQSIDSFYLLYYYPDNVLKILHEYGIKENFQTYYESFLTFLELSMYKLTD